jgi:5-methylthioribose kinase
VCLKQSLPYVRCVGAGWPLSLDRCRIEAEALALQHKLCPQHVPEVCVGPGGAVLVLLLPRSGRHCSLCSAQRLRHHALLCALHVPLCAGLQVYLHEPSCAVLVMELLAPPNIVLRHAIVGGALYPAFAAHMGAFLAATLFHTSLLALDTRQFRCAAQRRGCWGAA